MAVYRHRDVADLEARLAVAAGRPIIVTDSVFSMDGDAADLAALDRLARRHGAWLVVDEAHALGTTGPGGRGLAAEPGVAATTWSGWSPSPRPWARPAPPSAGRRRSTGCSSSAAAR